MKDFLSLGWGTIEGPLIEPPLFSPVIADPSFLFPEETPDGDWQLFAHSAWGIHRYSSPDGLAWRDQGIVARNAMRPFARRIDGMAGKMATGASPSEPGPYCLYFEAYKPFALPMTALPGRRKWHSTIRCSRSADLAHWSQTAPLLRPELPWMCDPTLGESVSNPCLVSEPREPPGACTFRLRWPGFPTAASANRATSGSRKAPRLSGPSWQSRRPW